MSKFHSMPKMLAFAGAVCALGASQFAACADVKYTQETRMPHSAGASEAAATDKPVNSITTFIMKGAERQEMRQEVGAWKMYETTLTLCAKRQRIRMDDALKIYTVASLDRKSAPRATSVEASAKPSDAKPTTGKVIFTPTVKYIGVEMVAGRKARHYMLTSRIQTSGCAGDADTSSKMEIWVADYELPDFNCGTTGGDWTAAYRNNDGCTITSENKGDYDAYLRAYKGLILRMKMYDDKGEVMMVQEMTTLSEAKLDTALFAVPAGYKELSGEEYDKARSAAMTTAMQARTGAGNNGASNASASAADDDEAALDAQAAAAVAAENGGNANQQSDDDNVAERAAKEAVKNQITKKKRKFGLPF